MNKFILLLALVAVAAAAPVSDVNLLKGIMELLEQKRSMSFMTYTPSTKKLMVSYLVSVTGDKSKTLTRTGTKGHHLRIFDDKDTMVYETTEKYMDGYGAPTKTYVLPFVKDGVKYNVKACEINKDDKDAVCNEGQFEGGKTKGFW